MDVLYFLVQNMFFFTIPLIVVALGGMFSERSGVVNIALEGIMLMGAFFGAVFLRATGDVMSGQLQLILALLVAGLSGAIFALFHAYASINMNADQTVSGTALNLFATAFVVFFARVLGNTQQVQFANTFYLKEVPVLSKIPVIGDLFFKNAYITTYIGFIILAIAAFVLFKTRFGLRLRSCGENPHAADAAGINVRKIRYAGVIISGFLGGMGGLIYVVPTSTEFNATVGGYGFLALAVLIFGQWHPKKILFAGLFFGFMKTIASAYSGIPFLAGLGIPSEFYKMIPYIATLIVLGLSTKSGSAPRASGQPFDTGKR